MKILRSVSEIRLWRSRLGDRQVAFVPTMGSLHEGHAALLRDGRRRVPRSRGELVLSIFVNPTQFNDAGDLRDYPRDEAGDLEKAEALDVDVVFCPPPEAIYPPGSNTFVEVEGLDAHLCGATRPGHFRGVCTVVCKLWQLIQPDVALFGQKDFQQLAIVRRMHQDLFLAGEIVGVPTVREADGLALSSRNVRLSQSARAEAVAIPRFLATVRERFDAGVRESAALIADHEQALAPGELHYCSVVDVAALEPVEAVTGPSLVALAASYGGVRLIDNLLLEPD